MRATLSTVFNRVDDARTRLDFVCSAFREWEDASLIERGRLSAG